MMKWRTVPALALWALFVGVASAQEAREQEDVKPPEAQRDSMSEDIEIMRVLLVRNLKTIHSPNAFGFGFRTDGTPGPPAGFQFDTPYPQPLVGAMNNPGGTTWGQHVGSYFGPGGIVVEGAYLAGYGVVFSVSLPFSPREASAGAPRGGAGDADWDDVQRWVRGEKSTKRTDRPSRGSSVSDVVIKLLAENGKHFSQLEAREVLTVVITFRPQRPATMALAGMPGTAVGMGGRAGQGLFGRGGSGGPGGGGSAPGGFGGGGAVGLGGGGTPARSAHDYELLADLFLKQDKAAEAVEALKKALTLEENPPNRIRIYHKLARAYLAADQEAEAQKTLKTLADLREKAPGVPGTRPMTAAAVATAMSFPTQVVISAPKSLLDRVGSGQVSREEFRKAVKIERHGPKASK